VVPEYRARRDTRDEKRWRKKEKREGKEKKLYKGNEFKYIQIGNTRRLKQ
jgi:hypothetical protein